MAFTGSKGSPCNVPPRAAMFAPAVARGWGFKMDQGLLSSAPARDPAEAREPQRILLVDDLSIIRDMARAMLTRAGYIVDIAEDGDEAFRLASSQRYALILMDVYMPKIDGVSATCLIRGLDAPYGEVPILALTAEQAPDRIQGLLEAGMNGHLRKPFKRDELLEAIGPWVG